MSWYFAVDVDDETSGCSDFDNSLTSLIYSFSASVCESFNSDQAVHLARFTKSIIPGFGVLHEPTVAFYYDVILFEYNDYISNAILV